MNITNFIVWFIQQFINIGQTMLNKLDQIKIYNTVSLMDFIITIAIISAFLTIVITAPQLGAVNRSLNARDRQIRQERAKQARSKGK